MSENLGASYSRHMMIGYARVSTPDQVLDHQIDALTRAGVARADVHCDIASGAKASRPQLDLVLKLLRAGDTLVITRLDRLGRSVLHLVTLGAQLREREIGLLVLEQGIDTSTSEGRAMLGMLAVLAELQRDLIVANTRDGLAAARARGRKGGRRPSLTRDQAELAQKLYDAGEHTVQQIADIVRVKRSTLYGHLTSGRASKPDTEASPPQAPLIGPTSRTAAARRPLRPPGRFTCGATEPIPRTYPRPGPAPGRHPASGVPDPGVSDRSRRMATRSPCQSFVGRASVICRVVPSVRVTV